VQAYGINAIEATKRAGGKCEKCGNTKFLLIHHKDGNGWKSINQNNNIDNLMVLCNACHTGLHHTKK